MSTWSLQSWLLPDQPRVLSETTQSDAIVFQVDVASCIAYDVVMKTRGTFTPS